MPRLQSLWDMEEISSLPDKVFPPKRISPNRPYGSRGRGKYVQTNRTFPDSVFLFSIVLVLRYSPCVPWRKKSGGRNHGPYQYSSGKGSGYSPHLTAFLLRIITVFSVIVAPDKEIRFGPGLPYNVYLYSTTIRLSA